MLTKGAIGNLVNRYRAVLTKCNLINTFGSLAVASMLVLGGAGVAGAESYTINSASQTFSNINEYNTEGSQLGGIRYTGLAASSDQALTYTSATIIGNTNDTNISTGTKIYGIAAQTNHSKPTATIDKKVTINGDTTISLTGGDNVGIRAIRANGGDISIGKEGGSNNITVSGGNQAYGASIWYGSKVTLSGDTTFEISSSGAEVFGIQNRSGLYHGASSDFGFESHGNITVDIKKGGVYVIGVHTHEANSIFDKDLTINIINDTANATNRAIDIWTPSDDNDTYIKVSGKVDINMTTNSSASGIVLGGGKNNNFNSDIDINITSTNGIASGFELGGGTDINIDGDTTIKTSGQSSYGIRMTEMDYDEETKKAMPFSGSAKFNGNITIDAETAILIEAEKEKAGDPGNLDMSVTIEGGTDKTVQITGDIINNYASGAVSANFDNAESFLIGTVTDHTGSLVSDAGIAIGLSNGGTWEATGASTVNKLTSNGGIVDMSGTTGDISVTSLDGNELDVVMDAAKENTFKVTSSTETAVTAVASEDADSVSQDAAKKMTQRITANGEALAGVTAEVAEGIVNAGYTMNDKGEIIAGGGASSVTKAVLESASVATVSLDRILTNDVRKRLGDIRSDANTTGVWMRWDGGKMKGDAGVTNNFNTIQIGGDTKVAKNCRIGFAGSFTHGDTEFARGNGEMEGFSFALYGTWMGENGMFADVVARLGKFSTELNVEGKEGDMDNRVASLSAEYGWRLPVCQQFFIEPQVELAYTYVSSDDLQLGDAKFAFDSVDSLTGRAGVVFGWNLPEERGNVYARASVLQQFMGDAKVTGYASTGPTVHETDGDDTWLEYGIGANVKLTDSTYLWADVERTEGADVDEEWRGTVGVRFSF